MDTYYDDTKKAIEALDAIDNYQFSEEVINRMDDAVREVEWLLEEYKKQHCTLERMYELLDENNIEYNF